ncbi:peptidyl-tRNA hydrolase [Exophiala sideris]|uniref:peptidyl-tRNA hydrolase n=1 Tax=Exophiala sideris TaxID=1016849 RepID=A0A0D1YM23_9EURO|nr:peptidyl-tRNA hydrolase [Exophiala sideris]
MADKSPPSLAAVAVSSLILGLLAGYFLGQGSSIGLFGQGNPDGKKSWPNSYDVKVHADSSDEQADDEDEEEEDEDEGDGNELKDFRDSTEEVKLVLAVRTDLGMGKGKIAAQCSHATLACYKYLVNHPPSAPLLKRWEWGGQPKIAVQAKSEEELETLQAQAISLGLCAKIIHDAGRTQIAAGSATVLGVLGPKSVVDQVTGGLKLL